MSGGDCRKWPRHNIIQQIRQKAPINFRRPPQRGPRSVTKSHPIDGQRCEARFQALLQRPQINHVTDVKLLQGDLAEAWREGDTDYATVAMKFALKDNMVERASGRTVEGGERSEITELWTFMRARGGNWLLSAIQQT